MKTVNRGDFWSAVAKANQCEISSDAIFSPKAYLLIAERIDEILFDLPEDKKIEPE